MRPLFCLAAVCLGLASLPAAAQQQEEGMLQRIDKRNGDATLVMPYQDKSFITGRQAVSKGSAYVTDFQYAERVNTKAYDAKTYRSGQFWQGDFQFATDPARTATTTVIPNKETKVAAEDVPVKAAAQADKEYRSRDYTTREFTGRGHSQGALDAENAPKEPLTVDQVRELLNKNK